MTTGRRDLTSEPRILRATGAIVTIAALAAGLITVLALFRPSVFETGVLTQPDGPLTPVDVIALQKARNDQRNGARETGLKMAAGVGALAAGLLGWGRLELSRDERRLDRSGHLTDRYSGAVEHLGHATADVQLGGIYALERLGLDSEDHRLAVIEVLCAFVREHGAIPPGNVADEVSAPPAVPSVYAVSRQPVTVQAALNVLQRNNTLWNIRYDLNGAHLEGANLKKATLALADMSGADLRSAHLDEADLRSAMLVGTDFRGASLSGANLTKADLDGADLRRANLIGAHVTASFGEANLGEANLRGADLRNAYLWRANLIQAELWRAYLGRANLTEADLSGANLVEASLQGAILSDANLSGADLLQADLTEANLTGANFTGAILEKTNLRGANCTNVKWPEGFAPPKAARETPAT